jgi:cytochrome c oxidase subunit 1
MIFFMVMPALLGGFGNILGTCYDRSCRHGIPSIKQYFILAFTLLVWCYLVHWLKQGWNGVDHLPPLSGLVGHVGGSVDLAIFSLHVSGLK